MAYVVNDEEINSSLDEIIEKGEGGKKEKNMNLLNNHLTVDEFKKNDDLLWISVKFLANQVHTNESMVIKKTHDMFFNSTDELDLSEYDFTSMGTKWCTKSFGEKYCPWDGVSYSMYMFMEKFPNHPQIAKIKAAHKSMSNSNQIFTNVMVIGSNVPGIIGKCMELRLPPKAGYTGYVIKKQKGVMVKGKPGPKANVFAMNHVPTLINVQKTGDGIFDREWSFADEVDENLVGKSFVEILADMGKTLEDVEPSSLEEYRFENDEYVSDEHRADRQLYIDEQEELAKKWVYFNVPEVIKTSPVKFIKNIKDSDFIDESEDVSNDELLEEDASYATEAAGPAKEFNVDEIDTNVDDLEAALGGDINEDDLQAMLNEDVE